MRPILLIMWTAFQSFILRDNNNNNNNDDETKYSDVHKIKKANQPCVLRIKIGTSTWRTEMIAMESGYVSAHTLF